MRLKGSVLIHVGVSAASVPGTRVVVEWGKLVNSPALLNLSSSKLPCSLMYGISPSLYMTSPSGLDQG